MIINNYNIKIFFETQIFPLLNKRYLSDNDKIKKVNKFLIEFEKITFNKEKNSKLY